MLKTLIRRCPESGRVVGFCWHPRLAGILFPITGILAIAWFLLRVIPKPSRAEYPCQKLAAGIGAAFVAHVASLLAAFAGFRFLRKHQGKAAAVGFAAVAAVLAGYSIGTSKQTAAPAVEVLEPREGPNHPMGTPRGIFPGRVVWKQDFAATKWNGASGHWWDDGNIDQAVVEGMFSQALESLTGARSDKQSWELLFRAQNRLAGRGDRGYQAGEKIVVKLNCNAENAKPWANRGYPSPEGVNALVKQLVETVGVPGKCILLSDPSRMVGDRIYAKVRSNTGAEYQQVGFEGQNGAAAPQRVKPEPDMNSPVYFTMPGGKREALYFPKSFSEAGYIINYGLLRPHRVFGVTLSGKNYFGVVYDPSAKSFKPSLLHAFALWDYATPNKHGDPHSHPVLLGHKLIRNKTVLYFLDGLYTSKDQGKDVVPWKTLGGRWFSSVLMSQDPVALDSVGYDLIRSEPNLTEGNPSFNGNVDSYLHEAALTPNPPSGTKYDPENNGTVLESLGVHEHWNNASEKKYSRNLGRKEGIELLR